MEFAHGLGVAWYKRNEYIEVCDVMSMQNESRHSHKEKTNWSFLLHEYLDTIKYTKCALKLSLCGIRIRKNMCIYIILYVI